MSTTTPPRTPREVLSAVARALLAPRATALTAWRLLRRRFHPIRGCATLGWALQLLLVRGAWPAVMAWLQSSHWCIRWQRIVDTWSAAVRQGPAAVWVAALLYLAGPTSWWTVSLAPPAAAVLAFGIGRLTYRYTPRGRARGRFRADIGWATWPETRLSISGHAVRRKALNEHLRHDLEASVTGRWSGRQSPLRTALTIPATDCGSSLGKTAIGTPFPTPVYADIRGNKGVIAPTGVGKTRQVLDHDIIDWPGAVVSTQTSGESWRRTHRLRARRGPVYVVDPHGLTGRPSDLHWDPVPGCRAPDVAQQRASTMAAAANGDSDPQNAWFVDRAATILRTLLLTADVAGFGMDTVYVWGAGGIGGIERALPYMQRYAKRMPNGWTEAITAILASDASRQRDGIFGYLTGSVEFMSDPAVADLATADPDEAPFNVDRFLAARGALYLIAENREHASAGPYLAALADYIWHEAKRSAGAQPHGRHSPPLGIIADEAANSIVLPLPRLVTDSAKYGIFIEYGIQSRSQLSERFGHDGARTVWNGTVCKMISGGITDEQDLRNLVDLCGERDIPTRDGDVRTVPKLSVDELRRIPASTWLVIHRSTPVTLTHTRDVALRPDVLASLALPDPTKRGDSRRTIVAPVSAPAIEAPAPRPAAEDHADAGAR